MPLKQEAAKRAATKHTIYVVEDHTTLRRLIIDFVNNIAGLKVVGEAASAEDALLDDKQTRADLVLTDLSLPGMSGVDLAKQLCEQNRDRPVIVLSAHDDAYTIKTAFHAGASAYITKENPGLIQDVIARVLAGENGIVARSDA